MTRLLPMALALALALPATAQAAPRSYVGAQYRYWAFNNHNDLRDVLAYWMQGYFHVQLEYWDFVDRQTDDRFRPEVGLHLRDYRKSVYHLGWRGEQRQDRLWFGTDQVLSDHWVGRLEVSPIVARDSTLWVFSGGADYYWGSYHFASATLIHDPRGEGDEDLWVLPLRVRLANEENDWVQATFAPASQRTVGWALDVKKRWLRLGVERNSRYDFTNLDNVIYTVGLELPIARVE
jgi:hypothetical protein